MNTEPPSWRRNGRRSASGTAACAGRNHGKGERETIVTEILEARDWRSNCVRIEQDASGRWYTWELSSGPTWPLVSCTTVITKIFGRGFPPEAAAAAEHAGDRGTQVHDAVKLLSGGVPGQELDWDSLDVEVRPRVEFFDEWKTNSLWRPTHIETAFFDPDYQFACTPDQVGVFEGYPDETCVLELKPETSKTAGLQTAAQALAVKKSLKLKRVVNRVVLHLGAKKCVPVVLDKPATDRDAFLSGLHCYRYGYERKIFV